MVALQSSTAMNTDPIKKKGNKRKKGFDPADLDLELSPPINTPQDPELLTRTAWVDAKTALNEINKGKASGNKAALWLRAKMQADFGRIGRTVQSHAKKVLFLGCVLLLTLSLLGLKNAKMESRVEKLWVEEGGRLEREIGYVEQQLGPGAGATSEMIIQTPVDDGGSASVLTSEALLAHLRILKAATRVVVEKDDTAWKLQDLCYAQTIPMSELQVLDSILENLFPCAIITPLDCFWEGSKLLGPDSPVHVPLGGDEGSMLLSWTSLNPADLVARMTSTFSKFYDFKTFEDFMKRAGITSGYQERPCLDPTDPDCPATAPNKRSGQKPDVGAELTGGCYGFATRYNHWPEPLVVGGVRKNSTGHIVGAKGLQSVVQLMGEKDMYEFWSDTYKIHTLDWSREKAQEILTEWQLRFNQEVARLTQEYGYDRKYQINAFSSSNLDSVLQEFSEISMPRLGLGYLFMTLYAVAILFRWSDVVKSQAGLGLGGVLLVAMTIAGGLGLCVILGITFNATTSHIVPFLALGLGVDAMFLLVQNYADLLVSGSVAVEDHIGEVLSRTGVLILVIAVCIVAAFLLAAALIPIPAMRSLGLQAAVLAACNLVTMIFLFPALLALDLKRVGSSMLDVLCCYKAKAKTSADQNKGFNKVLDQYTKYIVKAPVKMLVTSLAVALTVLGLWGMTKVEDGLNLKDVVPRNTSVFNFLEAQDKYFGFYNMYAVTMGNFEYPQNQALIYDYQKAFVRVPTIIKDDNGGLPEFWLSLMRTWLVKVQKVFDQNYAQGCYHDRGWFPNATDEGILAFKLMVQTGHVDYPVDFTLQTRNRMVDAHGIINPNAFYNYLTAWYSNDAMAYSYSQANIMPKPREWLHDPKDEDLRIPKSSPITFAQIPFYLNQLGNTDVMVETIRQIRHISDTFQETKGLPNFPRGIPFTFWEQYLSLRFWLIVALAAILAAIFVVLTFVFMSLWMGVIAVGVITLLLVQLFGFLGVLGIRLSAIPALLLILTAGLGVQFTVHILMGFVTCIGRKDVRVVSSLSHMIRPVVHGALSTFLGIIILAFSDFDFIYRYFFLVLTSLIGLGLFNGLAVLPVVLTSLGPPAEVVPNNKGADHLAPISAPSTPVRSRQRAHLKIEPHHQLTHSSSRPGKAISLGRHGVGFIPRRHNSDASLSTIAEESNTYVSSSQENPLQSSLNATSVYVEPEVVVETTTLPGDPSSRSTTPTSQVTKVTATAKFKVEVHAPTNASLSSSTSSSSDRPSSRRTRRSPRSPKQPSTPDSSLSAPSSVSSSLSSNDGDLGFSER